MKPIDLPKIPKDKMPQGTASKGILTGTSKGSGTVSFKDFDVDSLTPVKKAPPPKPSIKNYKRLIKN